MLWRNLPCLLSRWNVRLAVQKIIFFPSSRQVARKCPLLFRSSSLLTFNPGILEVHHTLEEFKVKDNKNKNGRKPCRIQPFFWWASLNMFLKACLRDLERCIRSFQVEVVNVLQAWISITCIWPRILFYLAYNSIRSPICFQRVMQCNNLVLICAGLCSTKCCSSAHDCLLFSFPSGLWVFALFTGRGGGGAKRCSWASAF